MLKLGDLAIRPDIQLGSMLVSPSRRLVEGPGGHVHLEPLIMQVFLLLLDAGGKVVTRTELFDQCWGGVAVADASLNRTIVKIRRTGDQIAPGFFEIETIPRTGYRLTGEILRHFGANASASAGGHEISRRLLVGSGAAAAVVTGTGLWWLKRPLPNPRFDALMKRGEEALRLDEPRSAGYFKQAVAIEPGNAKAWGLLAYALGGAGGDMGPDSASGAAALATERAARTALRIDSQEPNALLAMTFIRSDMLDRIAREDWYRRILSIDPDNTRVMRSLGQFLHGVGRSRESLDLVERALAIEPLSPDHQARKAMRLWTLGSVPEADRVIDRALQLWPSHRIVRLARLMIYAFTGRAQAAKAIVTEEEANPILLTPATASIWRTWLTALETPTPSTVAAARSSALEGSKGTRAIAAYAILVLSALKELDAAFEVADGFLLSRGPVIIQPRAASKSLGLNSAGWRNPFGLFTPPTKAMRLDVRFKSLADGLGLTDYWRRRGIGPDAFLFRA